MSYTAHAYRDFSAIFAGQIEEIAESIMRPDDFEIAAETIQIVAGQVADLFEKDNPRGFDRKRFMADSGTPEE